MVQSSQYTKQSANSSHKQCTELTGMCLGHREVGDTPVVEREGNKMVDIEKRRYCKIIV